jgi:hypothetical protein
MNSHNKYIARLTLALCIVCSTVQQVISADTNTPEVITNFRKGTSLSEQQELVHKKNNIAWGMIMGGAGLFLKPRTILAVALFFGGVYLKKLTLKETEAAHVNAITQGMETMCTHIQSSVPSLYNFIVGFASLTRSLVVQASDVVKNIGDQHPVHTTEQQGEKREQKGERS